MKTHKGKFKPKNPSKYEGDPTLADSKHKCQYCDNVYKSLSKHLIQVHNTEIKNYYDQHCKIEDEDLCKNCGELTQFIGIKQGYKDYCSHSCGTSSFRKKLKSDPIKFNSFIEKIKINQSNIWKTRVLSGESVEIRSKIGNTITETNLNMTQEERNAKYGWLNKLTKEEIAVQNILEKSWFKFWREATEEEKRKIYDKRIQTRIDKGLMINPILLVDIEQYRRKVSAQTRKSYKNHKDKINPCNLKRGQKMGDYQIDHIFSVLTGYLQDVDPKIIGSHHNLRMLTVFENSSKSSRCDILLEDLLEKINNEG